MTNTISIRYGKEQDKDALIQFNQAMALETESKELPLEIISAGVQHMLMNRQLGFYVVAEKDGVIAGCLMVTTEWSDWRNGLFWWIQSVYVKPEFRRCGIYRNLYDFVKTRAKKEENVCGFRLYVERENLIAQKTYETLGMEETVYKMYEDLF